MKKLLYIFLLSLISLSLVSCNQIGNDLEDEFDVFFANNSERRYVMITISKTKISIDDMMSFDTKTLQIIYDQEEDTLEVVQNEYHELSTKNDINKEYKEYLFDFPFNKRDIDEYNEDGNYYKIFMKTEKFIDKYRDWYYITEMTQSSDVLDGTLVVIQSPDDHKYEWEINKRIYDTFSVGAYPLYNTKVVVEYGDGYWIQ